MLSLRTLISLSQYLALQPEATVNLLAQKCGAPTAWGGLRGPQLIHEYLRNLSPGTHRELLDEICRSTRMLRNDVSPKYLYDERWTDLLRCLLLDGYQIHGDYSTGYSLTALSVRSATTEAWQRLCLPFFAAPMKARFPGCW
jgi:hypothetical protein